MSNEDFDKTFHAAEVDINDYLDLPEAFCLGELFISGMNSLVDRAKSAIYSNGYVEIIMESGVELKYPIKGNVRLEGGSDTELNRIEISPFGLHWPDLDEDLSFRGIFEGNYGQKKSAEV